MHFLARIIQEVVQLLFDVLASIIMIWVLLLLPVLLHWIPPFMGLGFFFADYQTWETVAAQSFVLVAIIWPLTIFGTAAISNFGLFVSLKIERLFGLTPRLHKYNQDTADADFTRASFINTYATSHGYTVLEDVDKTDRSSLFLRRGGAAPAMPLIQGKISGQTFRWYRGAGGDVYVIILDTDTYPHFFVKTNINKGTSGFLDGAIVGTVPIKLEADFGKYFTVYAPDTSQVAVRTILTPDVMLTILESIPEADIEIFGGKMFIQFNFVKSEEAADVNIHAIAPVIKQVIEQQPTYAERIEERFKRSRYSAFIDKITDNLAAAILASYVFTSLFYVVVLFVAFIPFIGKYLLVVGVVLLGISICITVLSTLILFYGFIVLKAIHKPKRIVYSYRASVLMKSYRRDYRANS